MKLKKIFAIKNNLKAWVVEVLKEKREPWEIALGFAIGAFIGTLLTPGFNIILTLVAIALFRINKLSAMAGMTIFANPVVSAVVLLVSFKFGLIMTRTTNINIKAISISTWTSYFKVLVIGNVTLAIAIALISYIIVNFVFKRIEFKRIQKELIEEALRDNEAIELEEAMRRN